MRGKIDHLLDVTAKVQFFETELTASTGEHFNIFQILRIGPREVTTHSPILAELLDPRGRHGMGPCFLKLFVNKFDLSLDCDDAQVRQEHSIGPKTEGGGGRIDIRISDGNGKEIWIENKIHAEDQENQISRYLNSRLGAKVLYLTLDGRDSSEQLASKAKERLKTLSYKADILDWLNRCRKETAGAPLLRETIAQYMNLIKVLTGQNTNSRMQDQISGSILKDSESLGAYFALLQSQHDVTQKLVAMLKQQVEEIALPLNLSVDFDPALSGKYCGFHLFDRGMEQRNLCISFQFQEKDYRSLYFGLSYVEEQVGAGRSPITDCFERVFGEASAHSWWPAGKSWPERSDWWHDGTFQDIYSGKLKHELLERIEKLVAVIRADAEGPASG